MRVAEHYFAQYFRLKHQQGPVPARMVVRTYDDELEYLERINDHCWRIKKGFQPNMKVEVWCFSLGKRF